MDHARAQDKPQHGLSTLRGTLADIDATGAITPTLLATHHLPRILLENGPLAIRHVMGYLTTSVPGFSRIPPAKARRLVVGALEGRGSSGRELEDVDGDVVFEKVGWGRWDARRRGQPSRETGSCDIRPGRHPSPNFQGGLEIPGTNSREDRNRGVGTRMGADIDSEVDYDTPPEDVSMLEHEADKMSLDENGSGSSPESLEDQPMLDHGYDEVTDEEDWASIGAAALRQGSFPLKSGSSRPSVNRRYASHLEPKSRGRGGGVPSSLLAKSMPMPPQVAGSRRNRQKDRDVRLPGFPSGDDAEERAAVEALLKLASV